MNAFSPSSAPSTTTIELARLSPLARLLVEQALLMSEELELVAAQAPKGAVLDQCEEAAMTKGRELIRLALEKTTQDYLAAQEKKRLSGPAPVAVAAAIVAPTRRTS